MSVVVVGLNHRTVPLDVLERTAVSDAQLPKALADLCSRPYLSEAVVLSTCNRTEIYVVAERYHGALDDVRRFLSEHSALPLDLFSDHLYAYYDDAAVAHLFKVASGIDSVVVGEGEILGQVRRAWDRARAEGSAHRVLGSLFRHALEVGKRARTETAISRGTTSVPHAAVAMVAQRLGHLAGRRVLVLGAGEMGDGMALALRGAATVADVAIANRTWSRACRLAEKVGGRAVEPGGLLAALEEVDVLMTSTGSPVPVLDSSDLARVMAARNQRPLLIVDVAVPRDVDPAVGDLPGVTLLDMDDLRGFASAAVAGRRREVVRVEAIVAEEVARYLQSRLEVEVGPVVTALRARGEQVRAGELERFRARLDGLDARQREAVDALTRGIVNKLLHEPTVRLKEAAGSAGGDRLAAALRVLFDL